MVVPAQAVQPRGEGLGCTSPWGCRVNRGGGLSRCRSRDGGDGAVTAPGTRSSCSRAGWEPPVGVSRCPIPWPRVLLGATISRSVCFRSRAGCDLQMPEYALTHRVCQAEPQHAVFMTRY